MNDEPLGFDVLSDPLGDYSTNVAPWGGQDDPYKDRHTSFRNVWAAGSSPRPWGP